MPEEPNSESAEDSTPYAELDPEIVELCRAINGFPDLRTSASCQGYIGNHRDGEPWYVFFGPKGFVSNEAYTSIEFLAWLVNGGAAKADGFDVTMWLNSGPPYLNFPGRTMYFFIEGRNRHPNEFAEFIRTNRAQGFVIDYGEDDDESQQGAQ
jgi:hypothetical protein